MGARIAIKTASKGEERSSFSELISPSGERQASAAGGSLLPSAPRVNGRLLRRTIRSDGRLVAVITGFWREEASDQSRLMALSGRTREIASGPKRPLVLQWMKADLALTFSR